MSGQWQTFTYAIEIELMKLNRTRLHFELRNGLYVVEPNSKLKQMKYSLNWDDETEK